MNLRLNSGSIQRKLEYIKAKRFLNARKELYSKEFYNLLRLYYK